MMKPIHMDVQRNINRSDLGYVPLSFKTVINTTIEKRIDFSARMLMRIDNLYQYGTYRLVFPLFVNGQTVSDVLDAKFSIYNENETLVELSMTGGNITFNSGKLTVLLSSDETVLLQGSYTYELWAKLNDGLPYHTKQGEIQFNKTKVRF